MTPARYQRLKTIIADALELPPEERPPFLRQACAADAEVLAEAESLLSRSDARMEDIATDLTSSLGIGESSRAHERLGAYELVREIGRGGMGAVYLARRADEAFEKEVAIKLLKRGTDTDEVLRRFRAERQILARLEHPNIARLIDAGSTPEGLPYFVMEYVQGLPITEFARTHQLTARQRVELMLPVCEAVQFAHQNLVVHRDLKPRNILVTAEGTPKLLDFGIAKLLSDDGGGIEVTVQGGQRLTPGYASPEQVRGDAITTASDIYSLGALLYDLLAGAPPHRFETQNPSPTELYRVIVEAEPRSVSGLSGDLDTILRKALSKEPPRRYTTANEFADDLRRHLGGRPVRARPATFTYRALKFIARNKIAVAATAIVLISIAAGVGATLWQARETERQATLAQRRFNDVRKLARAVVFDYHDLVAPLRGSTPVRERLVRDAIEYLDALSRETAGDIGLLREMATAYEKVGRVQGNGYFSNLGDTEGALRSYRRSLEIREQLLARDPQNHELLDEVAKSYAGIGDVLYSKDDLAGALASYEKGLAVRLAGLPAAGDDVLYQLELVVLYSRLGDIKGMEQYSNLGDTAGALASLKEALSILERLSRQHPENGDVADQLANALTHAGMLACSSGDAASGLAMEQRALELVQTLAAKNPDSQSYEISVLVTMHWLCLALEDNGKIAEAVATSRHLIERLQRLLQSDPKNVQMRRNLGVAFDILGTELLKLGDVEGAMENHRAALATLEALSKETGSQELNADLASADWGLGRAFAARGDFAAAIENFRTALSLREPALGTGSANTRAQDDVASIYLDLGKALAAAGDSAKAEEAFQEALPLAEKTSAQAPSNARLRAHLATAYAEFGRFLIGRGEHERGREQLTKSAEIWNALRERGTLIPAEAANAEEVAHELRAL